MKEDHPLLLATKDLRGRLREWMDAPFFESRADWEKWLREFRPRVERSVKNATDVISHQEQQLPHDDDCTCGYCLAK